MLARQLRSHFALLALLLFSERSRAQNAAAVGAPEKSESAWQIPGTSAWLHLGGYAQLDTIYDFLPIASRGSFAISDIPFDGSTGRSLYFQVATSRLGLDATYPTAVGRARARIEVDFYSSSGAPRLRHAYGELGRVLAGQTWTTLMELGTLPPTLDFESPSGVVLSRQLMVRYTQPLGEGLELAAAAEYPRQIATAGLSTAEPGSYKVVVPDAVLKLRYESGPVLLHASTVVRYLRYEPLEGPAFEAPGYGVAASFRLRPLHWLTLWGEVVGGQGIGSFRGVPDLTLNWNNKIAALEVFGATGAVTVDWLDSLRSTLVFSRVSGSTDQSQDFEHTERGLYTALNLQWFPAELVMTGIEGLWGRRVGRQVGGIQAEGEAVRIQASMQVSLP
jgi:hypothetical protein